MSIGKSKALNAKKVKVKNSDRKVGFSRTAKDLLEGKRGEKHLRGFEYD